MNLKFFSLLSLLLLIAVPRIIAQSVNDSLQPDMHTKNLNSDRTSNTDGLYGYHASEIQDKYSFFINSGIGFGQFEYIDVLSNKKVYKFNPDIPLLIGFKLENKLHLFNYRYSLLTELSYQYYSTEAMTNLSTSVGEIKYSKLHLVAMGKYNRYFKNFETYAGAGLDASMPIRMKSEIVHHNELYKYRIVIPVSVGVQFTRFGLELRYTSPEQLVIWADTDVNHWSVMAIASWRIRY